MSRDVSRGDTKDLILFTQDLQRQLEGRRDANVKVGHDETMWPMHRAMRRVRTYGTVVTGAW